jgi:hypothetical protein
LCVVFAEIIAGKIVKMAEALKDKHS